MVLVFVLAALLGASVASAAKNGVYRGHIDGDESADVTIKVKDGRVTKVTGAIKVEGLCSADVTYSAQR